MKSLIRALAYTTILLGLAASPASAGLTINLGGVTLAPGGTGTMSITLSSTSAFTLSSFGLELQIAPIGTPTSVLQFTASAAQPTAPFGSANYVFAGNSFDQDFASPFWSIPTPIPMLSAVGGDLDDSNSGYVSIGASTSKLLATVQFKSPVGATFGDQFQISLVNNANFTYFDDLNGNPLNSGAYSVTGGVVTIAPTLVPEPSSLIITFTGLGGLLGVRYGRRMRKTSRDAPPNP